MLTNIIQDLILYIKINEHVYLVGMQIGFHIQYRTVYKSLYE